MLFHGLELNERMKRAQREEEIMLFAYLRRSYANRLLKEPERFGDIVADVRECADRINAGRLGTGPYLAVDAFPATDITYGYITVHHVTTKARARIAISRSEGEITLPAAEPQAQEGGEK